MNAIARKANPAIASRERKQRIVLIALAVILVLVLALELPKILHRSSSSSTAASTPTVATSTPAPAAATASAVPGTAASTTVNTTAPDVVRRERWIKRLPSRDPFVPLVTAASATSATGATALPSPSVTATPATLAPATKTPAAVATTAAAAKAKTSSAASKPKAATVKTVTVAPKLVPTAAVIWTDGQRQVVGAQQLFKAGDTTFKLISIGSKSATVSVPVGGIKGGKKEVVLPRDKSVTLENTVTGVQYVLRFTLPMSVVPTSSSSNGK